MKEITEEFLCSMVSVLEEVRRKRVCCYGSRSMCDCKYGGEHIGNLFPRDRSEPQVSMGGEGCGCPELRMVVGFLKRLSVHEVEELLEKGALR